MIKLVRVEPREWVILKLLNKEGQLRQEQIISKIIIYGRGEKAQLTMLLRRMSKKGLIKKNPESCYYYLTKAGIDRAIEISKFYTLEKKV